MAVENLEVCMAHHQVTKLLSHAVLQTQACHTLRRTTRPDLPSYLLLAQSDVFIHFFQG